METPQMFEGWAVVELLGHGREIGYVTTQYFGNQAFFLVGSPEIINEGEITLAEGSYWANEAQHRYLPAGSRVIKAHVPGKSRLVSSAAIFAINPSTEEEIKAEISANAPIAFLISEPEIDPEKETMPF